MTDSAPYRAVTLAEVLDANELVTQSFAADTVLNNYGKLGERFARMGRNAQRAYVLNAIRFALASGWPLADTLHALLAMAGAPPGNEPRGRWSYGPWGTGVPIFIEDPDFGVYVAPTAFLPFTLPPVPNPCRGTVFDRGALARAACGTRRARLDTATGPDVRTGRA